MPNVMNILLRLDNFASAIAIGAGRGVGFGAVMLGLWWLFRHSRLGCAAGW